MAEHRQVIWIGSMITDLMLLAAATALALFVAWLLIENMADLPHWGGLL